MSDEKVEKTRRLKTGELPVRLVWRTDNWAVSDPLAGRMLEEAGLASYIEGWGYLFPAPLANVLGVEFTYPQALGYAPSRKEGRNWGGMRQVKQVVEQVVEQAKIELEKARLRVELSELYPEKTLAEACQAEITWQARFLGLELARLQECLRAQMRPQANPSFRRLRRRILRAIIQIERRLLLLEKLQEEATKAI